MNGLIRNNQKRLIEYQKRQKRKFRSLKIINNVSEKGLNARKTIKNAINEQMIRDQREHIEIIRKEGQKKLNEKRLEVRFKKEEETTNEIFFKIQTTNYLVNIANNLKDTLEKMGFKCKILDTVQVINEIIYQNEMWNEIYILLAPGQLDTVPKKSLFYVYNLEQLNYFNDWPNVGFNNGNIFKKLINDCVYLFDYSQKNIDSYPEKLKNKAYFLPIPISNTPLQKESNNLYNVGSEDNLLELQSKYDKKSLRKKYDILFFGGISERRNKILTYLIDNTNYNIKILTHCFGNQLYQYIKKSKVVLNIHVKKKSLLETARIHDCINDSSPIILSEKSIDANTEEKYASIINIFDSIEDDFSNINVLLKLLDKTFDTYEQLQEKQNICINSLKTYLIKENNKSYNYFKRYKYPELFHKFILKISKPTKLMNYNVIKQEELKDGDLICHLHCFNLDKFNEIFRPYIEVLKIHFKIIITYTHGDPYFINDMQCNCLQIKNKGMDIGAKMVTVDYLKSKDINYEYIFMLHSKNNKTKRDQYFNSFFMKLNNILQIIYHKKEVGIITPDIIHGNLYRESFGINQININQISEYLDLPIYTSIFPEGNCYILHKDVAELLYGNKLFYNMLNTKTSFSLNWFKLFYRLKETNSKILYKKYLLEGLHANHLDSNLGYNGLADGMIEHVFERIVFAACIKLDKKIYIINKSNKELDYINNVLRFDSHFYKKLYPDVDVLHSNKNMLNHYLIYGKIESRKCNKYDMNKFQEMVLMRIKQEKTRTSDIRLTKKDKEIKTRSFSFDISETTLKNPLINILIRTSNRPYYFRKCIESILNQSYNNVRVIICYDNLESLDYLKDYQNYSNIEFFPVQVKSKKQYKFNLYCNELLKRVTNGYVLYLDDDDYLCHDECLWYLANKVQKNTITIWNFFRADKLIFPRNKFNIQLGEVTTSGFISDIECYKNCFWGDGKNGDYSFLKMVMLKNKPNIELVDKVITGVQMTDKIGHFGE